jgi:hypothetical protein
MKADLTTLDGQRKATRTAAYVFLGGLVCCVFWAILARYPEDRLQAAGMTSFLGGMLAGVIVVSRTMSLQQKWIDAGSAGLPPQQSAFERWFPAAALFLGIGGFGALFIASGSLYPHWHHVDRKHSPMYAMTLGSIGAAVSLICTFGWMLPAIYKAHFRKA